MEIILVTYVLKHRKIGREHGENTEYLNPNLATLYTVTGRH